jgi:hypothetical protein
MNPDAAMKLATMAAIAGALLIPPALVYLILRSRAWRIRLVGVTLALAASFYLIQFQAFPVSWGGPVGPPVTIEVILPDGYRGFVYLYFDSEQAPLKPSAPNLYTLLVPGSGRLRAGQFPGQTLSTKNVFFALHYLNGEVAPVAEGSQSGGSQARNGQSVVYLRPFIGSDAEFQYASRQRGNDQLQVLEEMRQAAKSPEKKEAPASLKGIERGPAP